MVINFSTSNLLFIRYSIKIKNTFMRTDFIQCFMFLRTLSSIRTNPCIPYELMYQCTYKRFKFLEENTVSIASFWVWTLVLKFGLTPKSVFFKKTDLPPSLGSYNDIPQNEANIMPNFIILPQKAFLYQRIFLREVLKFLCCNLV